MNNPLTYKVQYPYVLDDHVILREELCYDTVDNGWKVTFEKYMQDGYGLRMGSINYRGHLTRWLRL